MKKIILLLLCVFLLLPLYGCDKNDEPEWKKKVDMIEEGMPYSELVELMGGPGTNLHTNEPYFMYILPDKQVLVICLTNNDEVMVKPFVATYERFKELFDYYPDDPEAPWNDPESPWNGDD
jgi:hypothetical protein